MLIHREESSASAIAIPQTSHAWMAWQIGTHWGNRRVARPAPRADVLAAILLHDGGWTEFDVAPGVDDEGRPQTFDRMPLKTHLAIWRTSVTRTAQHSRYAALLAASHFASLAERKTADLLAAGDTAGARAVQSFTAEMERLQDAWRESLAMDPRYEPVLEGSGWEANLRLLIACDTISVYLCASLGSSFEVEVESALGEAITIHADARGEHLFRLSPWPLEGDGLKIQCEGRRLVDDLVFADRHQLREALLRAPAVRLSFELRRPSAES